MPRTNVTELTDKLVEEITMRALDDMQADFIDDAPATNGWTWVFASSPGRPVKVFFTAIDDDEEETDEDGNPVGEDAEFEVTVTVKRIK